MLQATLAVEHGCALCELTTECPEARVALWCNYHHDAIELTVEGDGGRCIDALWRRAPGAAIKQDPGNPHRYHAVFPCIHKRDEGGVQATAERLHCIALSPIIYEAGWETHRVVAWDDDAFARLYQEVAADFSVDVKSKRQLEGSLFEHSMILSANDLLGNLTDRQLGAVEQAVSAGYYETPRQARVQDIAEAAGVPRTTFQEHLQKGEAKLLQAVAPLLGLRRAGRSRP